MERNDHMRHAVDLGRLSLSPGQGRRLDLLVEPGPVELGGSEYALRTPAVTARLDVSRTAAGFALRLRFPLELSGPCMRCLGNAVLELEVDSREVDQASADDEELRSPYVEEELLELDLWAHDALVLALPTRILCRADCAGLCPVCGESLNDAAAGAHDHPAEPDPRWAKLREIEFE